ncbi:cysteine proteinase [Metschnikowia bicuspidata]|uniref:Cysteine protease RIM13 n=1 Tax=Metschnikowia bicuspidata TaxID=27322 RepID=A0A4P9ZEJ4_9ASCO|nr:cysteine proteinase [Metschnikowia bicuspidata]
MEAKDLIAQCCWNLQKSHLFVAKNDLARAKKHCLAASTAINGALQNKTNFSAPTITEVAQFTLKFHKRLLDKGLAALLAQEKLQWLASTNCGRDWYPILNFGNIDSTGLASLELVDDKSLRLPKLSSDFAVEFTETLASLSIERQISALKLDLLSKSIKPGTLALSDLYQDLLTNCSFVLSLLSIAELGMELDLRSLVTFHGNSRAKVQLFFNGSSREISITTRLPFVLPPHESRSLHVRSLSFEALTWPAILEKAFLIALGEDYTFSGSNMAQDTYSLIGWIPEIRKTSNCTLEEIAESWSLKEKGLVALGLGTGPMSDKLALQLEVVPEHDYVFSHFDEKEKILLLRNPWTAEKLTQNSMQQNLRVDLSLLGQFSYLYLNWNPASFQTCRATFPCVPLDWPEIYLADKPQYFFTNNTDKPQEVIVLVEKYFRTSGDMCVSVWEGTKNLIYSIREYPLVEGGLFHGLRLRSMKFIAKPLESYVISVSSHDAKGTIYSLDIFHNMDNFMLSKVKAVLPKKTDALSGRWYGPSRGGSWANETCINNPQYDLKVATPFSLAIVIATKSPNVEVAVHLFHCEASQVGRKLKTFERSKLFTNVNYSKLICILKLNDLEPGNYRIVVSALDCKENEEYQIVLSHDAEEQVELKKVPASLGTFEQKHCFEWNGKNRTKYLVRSEYSRTKMTIQMLAGSELQTLGAYIPAVRASLFDFKTGKPVKLTTEWNNSLYGVFLDCELAEKDRDYVLLIERFEPGDGTCRIHVGSNSRVKMKELQA